MNDRVVQLTERELEDVIERSVSETLTKMGVDVDDPLEMQADFLHLREWREATESMKRKGLLTLFGILITGACGLAWLGLKHTILGP